MHADAELHRLVGDTAGVLRRDRGLHGDSALDGIDCAGEVGDHAIPGGAEDAAPVRGDQLINDHPACLQPGERADLVTRHQPAVAGNIRRENRGNFALHRMDGHVRLLPIRV